MRKLVKCRECGSENPDDTEICVSCGEDILSSGSAKQESDTITECERVSGCNFFRFGTESEARELAFRGFLRRYCRGARQNQCVRKKVAEMLGDPKLVPFNMMPNGYPLPETDDSEWSSEVKAFVFKIAVERSSQ